MTLYNNTNLSLFTDFYELTMMQGYYLYNRNYSVVFDMAFRKQPFSGGYTVFAGLEPLVKAILNLKFTDTELTYLKGLNLFKPEFLDYLSKFRFNGDIYSVEEGELIFPEEPILRIHSNIIEAQLIETLILNIINFQSLIATKTARITDSAKGKPILEFGARRAQGIDGALSASRAAYIGGAYATSNVLAGRLFNIPVRGTMAHSWIMSFGSEQESFDKYVRLYPNNTILLVDTYNTLKQGIPAAIKTLKKLKKRKITGFGIRLDSGDLEYLSSQARYMLDKAGLKETKIVVSNELDEHIIEHLINNNAPIDYFGVGTNLVTGNDCPSLSGVYKLVARKNGKLYTPIIKISNNPGKTTNPGVKNVLRLYDKDGFITGDLIFMESEKNMINKRLTDKSGFMFYHPKYDYQKIEITGYNSGKIMLKNIVLNGKLNYQFPKLNKIRELAGINIRKLHPSFKRLLNPHIYKVSISKNLTKLKFGLIKKYE